MMCVSVRLRLFLALIVATHMMYKHILCILKVHVTLSLVSLLELKTTGSEWGYSKQSIISCHLQ